MRYSAILLIWICYTLSAIAQKPALDTSAFRKWAGVGGGELSPDGAYVAYQIRNDPPGSKRLVVRSTFGKWKKDFPDAGNVIFSGDSKRAIFKTGDSLRILTLGKEDEPKYIPGINEFELASKDSGNCFLAYRPVSDKQKLIVRDLVNANEQIIPSVLRYQFLNRGEEILFSEKKINDSSERNNLVMLNLSTGERMLLWSGRESDEAIGSWIISGDEKRIAFLTERKKGTQTFNELWYYDKTMTAARKPVDSNANGIPAGLEIAGVPPEFSSRGDEIFFSIVPLEDTLNVKSSTVKMDVWSYTDTLLQPLQKDDAKEPSLYLSVINIASKKITVLEGPGESVVGRSDDFVLLKAGTENVYAAFESNWNRAVQPAFWLVSLKDGSRKLLKDHIRNLHEGLAMSPGGKWILYYDKQKKNFFSFEISTGITRNITKKIPVGWVDSSFDRLGLKLNWVPWRETWLQDDEVVLIYDNWDVWEVDPAGKKPPVNLTSGYGRRNHIRFRLASEDPAIRECSVEKQSELLLTAFDEKNKNRGFYSKRIGITGDPVLRIMGAYTYDDWSGNDSYESPLVKAKNSNTYLLLRMSAVQAPNYFVTHDMIHLTALTNLQPQKKYNWLRTELIHWKTLDGRLSEGILYKPEDFDPKKKYPVIFDFYEIRSDELNLYIWPENAQGRINIPWYVSHGYLVCTPDIHYKTGEPGRSAYNSVFSAAKFLSQFPWVDENKMGIQGHSFGGYEVNYIVTHSKMFSAACSASGITNLFSWYGSVSRGSYAKFWAEYQQGRMGATPWEIPQNYIDESPIFKTDKVTTPILLMANKGDGVVPFTQSLEFFTGLRRLGKRAWLLQYDQWGHSVGDEAAADFSLRMWQFFDHYLKGAPAPRWMTRGIPAKMREIDNGFELETSGIEPGPGLNVVPSKKN